MDAEIKTFRVLCCRSLGIPLVTFERIVLFECLPRCHWLVGKLVWHFNSAYFKEDLKLIRTVADCTNMRQLCSEVMFYRYNPRVAGFQRKLLRARISGRRLLKFAERFLSSD
jgi:hypothetical protein